MGNSAVWKPPCPTLRKGSFVPLTKSLLNSSAYPNHLLVNKEELEAIKNEIELMKEEMDLHHLFIQLSRNMMKTLNDFAVFFK